MIEPLPLFNQVIVNLPSELRTLRLSEHFNSPLGPLPAGLEELTIANWSYRYRHLLHPLPKFLDEQSVKWVSGLSEQ